MARKLLEKCSVCSTPAAVYASLSLLRTHTWGMLQVYFHMRCRCSCCFCFVLFFAALHIAQRSRRWSSRITPTGSPPRTPRWESRTEGCAINLHSGMQLYLYMTDKATDTDTRYKIQIKPELTVQAVWVENTQRVLQPWHSYWVGQVHIYLVYMFISI